MLAADRLADAVRSHRTSVIYAFAVLALAGAGSAGAATIARPVPRGTHLPVVSATWPRTPARSASTVVATTDIVRAADGTSGTAVPFSFVPARTGVRQSPAVEPAAVPGDSVTTTAVAAAVDPRSGTAAATHAAPPRSAPQRLTFAMVQAELNRQTNPALAAEGVLPAADKLLPAPTSGGQSFTPIDSAQYQNATAIVAQALTMHMGIRSAVIAVATAIQESDLVNVGYGTGESLGLFQQQPDMGWGTAEQIMDPTYAAGVFLGALQQYQATNPGWATQPLYQVAQGVQESAFPYAYAQWETQAAQLVSQIVMQLR